MLDKKAHPRISESPLHQIHDPFLDQARVRLFIKRDELIHPEFGGNKWRKLKYNLQNARKQNLHTLLTFGGAWSNHIYATAAAGKVFGFDTIGIIRGESHEPLNPCLSFAQECGMKLHYLDREAYRDKNSPGQLTSLKAQYGKVYILPEGGSNKLALPGCSEIVSEVRQQVKNFDVICCACGTGATLAGIITALDDSQQAIGFSALRGGEFLNTEVQQFLNLDTRAIKARWSIETAFHFGGYGKIKPDLVEFIQQFRQMHNIQLDAVYTGKMIYGLYQQISNKVFSPGTTIIAVHSGGLQGNKGFNLEIR